MRFCLDWRLCRFASVAIVPQAFFFLGPCRLQIQTHIESFMRPSMGEAHVGSHAGNLMNMFSYLGVSQKPTGQHRGECEKVSDSQGPVPVPVHVFRGRKDQAISSITTGGNLNYSCLHSVCFSIYFYKSEALEGIMEGRDVDWTLVIIISQCKGALFKGWVTLGKAFCLQVSIA